MDGVGNHESVSSQDQLVRLYDKKYREKTRKGYTEVKMALGHSQDEKEEKKKSADELPDSKLDKSQQELIKLIFDMKMIESSIVKIGFDPTQLPLGQLEESTIQEGFKYLRMIESVLEKKADHDLVELSSKFYTHIPHIMKGKKITEFTIDTKEKLKEKMDLV